MKHKNGYVLSIDYKPKKLSQFMAKNASGSKFISCSGSKRKYQTRNTTRTDDQPSPNPNFMHVLTELIVPSSSIVNYIDNKNLFDERMIITDHLKLTKIFLADIDFVKVF